MCLYFILSPLRGKLGLPTLAHRVSIGRLEGRDFAFESTEGIGINPILDVCQRCDASFR
jgi:hypothetical protein